VLAEVTTFSIHPVAAPTVDTERKYRYESDDQTGEGPLHVAQVLAMVDGHDAFNVTTQCATRSCIQYVQTYKQFGTITLVCPLLRACPCTVLGMYHSA
jgi:hypothetical protein